MGLDVRQRLRVMLHAGGIRECQMELQHDVSAGPS